MQAAVNPVTLMTNRKAPLVDVRLLPLLLFLYGRQAYKAPDSQTGE